MASTAALSNAVSAFTGAKLAPRRASPRAAVAVARRSLRVEAHKVAILGAVRLPGTTGDSEKPPALTFWISGSEYVVQGHGLKVSPPPLPSQLPPLSMEQAGGIGQPLSLLLKMNPLVTQLALFDIANTPGVACDLSHCNTPAKVCFRVP